MRRPAGALASVLASVFAAVAAVAAGGGCLVDDKGEEEEEALLDDGKDDSFRNPTYHGGLAWDEAAIALLTLTERHHAWTFELSGDARVELTTGYAVRGQRKVDTVLYLYREGFSFNAFGTAAATAWIMVLASLVLAAGYVALLRRQVNAHAH